MAEWSLDEVAPQRRSRLEHKKTSIQMTQCSTTSTFEAIKASEEQGEMLMMHWRPAGAKESWAELSR